MKKRNGFTLVELLAVIVILAIILVIAVPQIMDVIEDARQGAFESSVKMVASAVENQYTLAETLSKEFPSTGDCTTADWTGLTGSDYGECKYTVNNKGEAYVTLKGATSGKFTAFAENGCGGTTSDVSCPPTTTITATAAN